MGLLEVIVYSENPEDEGKLEGALDYILTSDDGIAAVVRFTSEFTSNLKDFDLCSDIADVMKGEKAWDSVSAEGEKLINLAYNRLEDMPERFGSFM